MAIEVTPGEQAWATYRRNTLARWPTREDPTRLHPLAAPQATRVFKLHGDEKVFCIGSCFAREIENALQDLGFDVLSIMRKFPKSPNRVRSDRGMFNKYNAATILNELRWAFGEGDPYCHEDVLIGAPGDLLLQDYQLAGVSYAEEPGHARAFREGFNAFFQSILQADVVVLTLGLSEVWFDRQSGLHLNNAPSEHLVACHPGRFELHVFDHAQTLALLEEIDRLLLAHLRPGFRTMITVSPVPLRSTFRDQDVLVANSYSKSVLRAAIDAFVTDRAHVSYFPSYEFALLSNPNTVWGSDDFRHVDPAFVDFIMQSVLLQFGSEGGPVEAERELTRSKLLQRAGFSNEAGGGAGRAALQWLSLIGPRLRRAWRQRGQRAVAPSPAQGHLDRWDGRSLTGWAFVNGEAGAAQVSVLVDGALLLTGPANLERPDVARVHGESRRHSGFHFELQGQHAGEVLSVQVAGKTLKTLPLAGDSAR